MFFGNTGSWKVAGGLLLFGGPCIPTGRHGTQSILPLLFSEPLGLLTRPFQALDSMSRQGAGDISIITGEDVDLILLLTALVSTSQKRWRRYAPSVLYSAASCKINPQNILFLRAVSGRETTSTHFGQGKKKICRKHFHFRGPESNSFPDFRDMGEVSDGIWGEHGNRFTRAPPISSVWPNLNWLDCHLPKAQPLFGTHLQIQTWLLGSWLLTRGGIVPIRTTPCYPR